MKKITKLNVQIQDDLQQKAVNVDDEEHDVLTQVINSKNIEGDFSEDSPQWLLWQQQKLQASKSNSKGMRWHPLIIRYIFMFCFLFQCYP